MSDIAPPTIKEMQVTGIPDDKNGEELIALVKLAPDADLVTGDKLREFCKGKIADRGRIPDDHDREDPEVQDAGEFY